jgi:hypothetical protein
MIVVIGKNPFFAEEQTIRGHIGSIGACIGDIGEMKCLNERSGSFPPHDPDSTFSAFTESELECWIFETLWRRDIFGSAAVGP